MIQYKVIKWFNKGTREIFWGIDIRVNGEWCHLHDGEKPMFYQTKKEAFAAKKSLLTSTDNTVK